MRRLTAFALAIGLSSLASTLPAAAPPIEDPQGAVVAELVVRAKLPGPAWWKVTSGGSTVWVLGVPGSLPKGLKWDVSVLARLLAAPPPPHPPPPAPPAPPPPSSPPPP